jgi:hypothetical protein
MKTLLSRRLSVAAASLVAIAGLVAIGQALGATATAGKRTRGTAWVGQAPKPGSLVFSAGFVKDSVLGNGAVTFTTKPIPGAHGTIKIDSKLVTIWTAKGSLSGTGTATLTVTNKPNVGDDTVSGGRLLLTRGTGEMAGHSVRATFSGGGNLNTGRYVFKYAGVYK